MSAQNVELGTGLRPQHPQLSYQHSILGTAMALVTGLHLTNLMLASVGEQPIDLPAMQTILKPLGKAATVMYNTTCGWLTKEFTIASESSTISERASLLLDQDMANDVEREPDFIGPLVDVDRDVDYIPSFVDGEVKRRGVKTLEVVSLLRVKFGVPSNTEENRQMLRRFLYQSQQEIFPMVRVKHLAVWIPRVITMALTPTLDELRQMRALESRKGILPTLLLPFYPNPMPERVQEMDRLRKG